MLNFGVVCSTPLSTILSITTRPTCYNLYMLIITISHVINVLVAGGIGTLLLMNKPSMTKVYGEVTPARSILASVYLAIAATSIVALLFPAHSIAIATVLFPLQIVYKFMTFFAVRNINNPVVISNVIISVILLISLISIFTHTATNV